MNDVYTLERCFYLVCALTFFLVFSQHVGRGGVGSIVMHYINIKAMTLGTQTRN